MFPGLEIVTSCGGDHPSSRPDQFSDMPPLILGTRGSALALAQTRIVQDELGIVHPDLEVRTKVVKTTGDQRLDVSLASPGALDKGLFTKELEQALCAGEIHAAVHSLKDLPVEVVEELILGAILARADYRDVLVSKQEGGIDGLSHGAQVATSSPRRRAQLRKLRPDLCLVEIRGNVPTRLDKLAKDDSLHGVILAKAGLDRLGHGVVPNGLYTRIVEGMLPAPGQGAIAVQCRRDDAETRTLLAAIHHDETARCVTAERAFLRSQGGGCNLPVAALAVIENGEIRMQTFVEGDS